MQTFWKSAESSFEAPYGQDELWIWSASQSSQERARKEHNCGEGRTFGFSHTEPTEASAIIVYVAWELENLFKETVWMNGLISKHT